MKKQEILSDFQPFITHKKFSCCYFTIKRNRKESVIFVGITRNSKNKIRI